MFLGTCRQEVCPAQPYGAGFKQAASPRPMNALWGSV